MSLFSQDMLKISSNLVRQVNTPAFEEVIKKKAATKKVCDTYLYIILLHELPSWIKYSRGEHYHVQLSEGSFSNEKLINPETPMNGHKTENLLTISIWYQADKPKNGDKYQLWD